MKRLFAPVLALWATVVAFVHREMNELEMHLRTDYDNGIFPFAPDDPGAGGNMSMNKTEGDSGVMPDDSVFIRSMTDGAKGVTAKAWPYVGAVLKSIDVIADNAARRATAVLTDLPGIMPPRRLALAT